MIPHFLFLFFASHVIIGDCEEPSSKAGKKSKKSKKSKTKATKMPKAL